MKTCTKCKETKELKEFYIHKRYKDGYQQPCKDCHPATWSQERKDKRSKIRASRKKPVVVKAEVFYKKCSRCGVIKHISGFYVRRRKDRPSISASSRCKECSRETELIRRKNSEKRYYPRRKEVNRNWCQRNPGKVAAKEIRRKRSVAQAIPSWANIAEINAIYKTARLNGLTVDHIVPIKSPVVCGLHCESNLRLLSKSENSSKGNKWPL